MNPVFSDNLMRLAEIFPKPLYAVGGYVRNALLCGESSEDIDLAAPVLSETAAESIKKAGFNVLAHYPRTGTVLFKKDNVRYEYTSFRKDEYSGGGHLPENTTFTNDILTDALRRDFKCNAVYFDIKKGEVVDPLGGVYDIHNKVLDTVSLPETVFSHDGLRLMRLARFTGELGFTPKSDVLDGAKEFSDNVSDVAAERIYEELKKILVADKKYAFSDPHGHYSALKVLDRTEVLDRIFPELTLGRGMEQRKDFHHYDVLQHSLKCVYYAKENVRLAALLHDVGKPERKISTGRFFAHDKSGVEIFGKIAKRLRMDSATEKQVSFLIGAHMRDLDGKMSENKIKLFIVQNRRYFDDLMALKQADFSACRDDVSECPTVKRWKSIYSEMIENGTPFTVKELKITPETLLTIGIKRNKLGETLKKLLDCVVTGRAKNDINELSVAATRMLD
ncbi:MAG: HD domain-containing protein [Clostridia bacterium]|nr:HD domain-containing protein [Clostridia bacterium]